jgi:hypothetical protein
MLFFLANYAVVLFRATSYRPRQAYQGKNLLADGSAFCHCGLEIKGKGLMELYFLLRKK